MWRLKQLDVYPKFHKEVTTKTISGAIGIICFIVSFIYLVLLLFSLLSKNKQICKQR